MFIFSEYDWLFNPVESNLRSFQKMKLVHRDFEKDGAGRLILIPEEAEVGTLIPGYTYSGIVK